MEAPDPGVNLLESWLPSGKGWRRGPQHGSSWPHTHMPASPPTPAPASGPRAVVVIPEEGRIQESRPTRWLPLQPPPHTLDRGRYLHGGVGQTGRYPGRAVSGRVDPYTGPWGYHHGGWGRRGGGKSPLPCLCIQYAPTSLSPGQGGAREARGTPPEDLCFQCAGIPHPARPPASSPAPRGGGSRGDIRGKAVPGAHPHTLDRGGYRHGGWGRRGGGKKPPPLSLLSICRHPLPRPASGLLLHPEGDIRGGPYPGRILKYWTVGGISTGWGGMPGEGRTRESRPPRRLPLQALPHTLDRGRYRLWGRGRRGGGKKPPPLSLHSICWRLSPQAEGHQRSQRTTPRGSLISM